MAFLQSTINWPPRPCDTGNRFSVRFVSIRFSCSPLDKCHGARMNSVIDSPFHLLILLLPFAFSVKTGQKRPINSPASMSNPHLAMPNAIPPGAAGQQGGAAGSGPFASALRSLAIKADTKDDEPTNEGGTDLSNRDGPVSYERSRDSNQPANLSKQSVGNNSRGSVPQHQDHARVLHHGQVGGSGDRGRTESGLNDDRLAQKKKLTTSPPPEKVRKRIDSV